MSESSHKLPNGAIRDMSAHNPRPLTLLSSAVALRICLFDISLSTRLVHKRIGRPPATKCCIAEKRFIGRQLWVIRVDWACRRQVGSCLKGCCDNGHHTCTHS